MIETYTYDVNSNLTEAADKNGNTQKNTYDYQNRLTEMVAAPSQKGQEKKPGKETKHTYTYNAYGDLATQDDTAFVYEAAAGQVTKETTKLTTEYLANGQKSRETFDVVDKDGKKSVKTATYTYDLLGRITKETKTGSGDISYTYDGNNNRKKMTVGNKVTAYKYNKNDELLRTDTLNTDTEEDSVVIYKNDRNGNQLATVNRYEMPSDKKDSTYVDVDVTLGDNRLNENVVNYYNALNQLTKTLTKNYKVGFTYDAEGLRTSKTVNGEKTVFVWDGDQLVMELSESGKVQKRYIRGNDLVYVDKGTDTEKQYYVTDPHGNVVQLTDESGKVIKTYEYDSFGNEVNPDGKDENPFRYCGEYYDKETEEVYLRARYYMPEVGRFLTRDTYTGEEDDPESLHLYAYCGNDGVNGVDPSGHDSYVIYDKTATAGDGEHQFKDEAKIVQKRLKKQYRRPCYLIAVKNAKHFKTVWSNLGKIINLRKRRFEKVKIDEVYLIFHGSIMGDVGNATGYMYCSDRSKIIARGTSFYNSGNDVLVSELTRKRMRKLTFSCCNTANPDCYNVADAFIKIMNVRQVDGFDGGAYFNYKTNTLEMGQGSQPTWWEYVPKTIVCSGYIGWVPYYQEVATRERMGMRTYRHGRWSKLIMRQNGGGNRT